MELGAEPAARFLVPVGSPPRGGRAQLSEHRVRLGQKPGAHRWVAGTDHDRRHSPEVDGEGTGVIMAVVDADGFPEHRRRVFQPTFVVGRHAERSQNRGLHPFVSLRPGAKGCCEGGGGRASQAAGAVASETVQTSSAPSSSKIFFARFTCFPSSACAEMR